jgi:hypothetical protein
MLRWRKQITVAAVSLASVLVLAGARSGTMQAPLFITSFTITGCHQGPGAHDTWEFEATTTGSSGGLTWEIRGSASSAADPASGNLIAGAAAPPGNGWTLDAEGETPNSGNTYVWLRFYSEYYDTGWFALDQTLSDGACGP